MESKKWMLSGVLAALVDGLFFIGRKWTQVDGAVMQPFNCVDSQFDLFLIACCQVNKWLDFSDTGQTMIL